MTRRARNERPPTARQIECFETYAILGSQELAATKLGISIQQLKDAVGEYYARVGANSGIQAAYLRWAPKTGHEGG